MDLPALPPQESGKDVETDVVPVGVGGRVAVVGFGFAGAAAAVLLARQNYRVTLWEATPHPGPVGAGILLQPSGQAVLADLGALESTLSTSERILALRARNARGKYFLELALEGAKSTFGVRRGRLFDALREQLATTEVDLRCGVRMTGLEFADQAAFLLSAEGRHGPYDFIVVADGSRSQLRACLGLPILGGEYHAGALWFCGQSNFPKEHLYQVSDGSRRLVGLLPTGSGQCSLFWSCDRSEWESYRAAPLTEWKRQVLQLAPEAEQILSQICDWQEITFATYRHHWLPHWWSQRAVLIGDAAHSMSPHLGQGTNLALLDAYSLAKSLRVEGDFVAACLRFQKVRQCHVALYSALSWVLTPFFQSQPDLVQGWGRDTALPLMLRWPWMRRQMIGAVWGQKPSIWKSWAELEEIT